MTGESADNQNTCMINPSMPASVQCTGSHFFTCRRLRYNVPFVTRLYL